MGKILPVQTKCVKWHSSKKQSMLKRIQITLLWLEDHVKFQHFHLSPTRGTNLKRGHFITQTGRKGIQNQPMTDFFIKVMDSTTSYTDVTETMQNQETFM